MNKKEVQQRVLQNGKPLSLDKFNWCEDTNTFSSDEDDLVLDFTCINGINGITFKTGSYCTFNTGSYCVFNTGPSCTFITGYYCTFDTGYKCNFKTGPECTFNISGGCTFECGEKCVCIRRDIYEVIELPEYSRIRLNENDVKGWKYLVDEEEKEEKKKIIIDGKEIELSLESGNNLKEQLK
jgi:hypothetical protein